MPDLHTLQRNPAAFRDELRIDADGALRPLGDVLDDWQRDDFAALDDGWKAVAGQADVGDGGSVLQRAYLERPRGHSKTSDLAVSATWALFASRRKINGYAAAADRDQAKLLHDSVETIVRLNPWLGDILDVRQWSVVNRHTGSVLEILASDAASAYGLRPDFLVVDELTHWPKRDLWDALISAAAKKTRCVVCIITNAGFGDTWQWDTRELVRPDPEWFFSRIDGPRASWINEKRLAEQRRLLPRIAFERLWLNRWTSGSGDALDGRDIDRALTLDGPARKAEPGWVYVAGLDLGLSRDKAALAVVGRHVGYWKEDEKPKRPLGDTQQALVDLGIWDEPEPEEPEATFVPGTGKLRLADLRVWNPADAASGRVSIEAVEEAIVDSTGGSTSPSGPTRGKRPTSPKGSSNVASRQSRWTSSRRTSSRCARSRWRRSPSRTSLSTNIRSSYRTCAPFGSLRRTMECGSTAPAEYPVTATVQPPWRSLYTSQRPNTPLPLPPLKA